MRKIRLTENQLHRLIRESVSTILETSMNTWFNASERAYGQGRDDLGHAFNEKFKTEYNNKYGHRPTADDSYSFGLHGGDVDNVRQNGVSINNPDEFMHSLRNKDTDGISRNVSPNHPRHRHLMALYSDSGGNSGAGIYKHDYGKPAFDLNKAMYDNSRGIKNKNYNDYLDKDYHPYGDYTNDGYPDFDKDPNAVTSFPNRQKVTNGMKAFKNITTHQNIWHPGKGWFDPEGNKCDY